jgi:response regulator RpfG family c-di-GMP phosphodiesterase
MKQSILMLEHDADDRYITQAVFDENNYAVKLYFVDNSNDLFAFLISCERNFVPYPALILLNHYAAPANAVDILKELKVNPKYSHIPVVVLSGTLNDEILHQSYAAGANSFIKKPSSSKEVNDKIGTFIRYWFETVELPVRGNREVGTH